MTYTRIVRPQGAREPAVLTAGELAHLDKSLFDQDALVTAQAALIVALAARVTVLEEA